MRFETLPGSDQRLLGSVLSSVSSAPLWLEQLTAETAEEIQHRGLSIPLSSLKARVSSSALRVVPSHLFALAGA